MSKSLTAILIVYLSLLLSSVTMGFLQRKLDYAVSTRVLSDPNVVANFGTFVIILNSMAFGLILYLCTKLFVDIIESNQSITSNYNYFMATSIFSHTIQLVFSSVLLIFAVGSTLKIYLILVIISLSLILIILIGVSIAKYNNIYVFTSM